jgi:heme/copper-type cytochrome/quinol oxidase subunit 2
MCQQVAEEAISNQSRTSADEDTLREARAYNNSILFMLAVPYACLGVLGLLFYRAVKVEQAKQLRSCIATANGETVLEIGSLPPISAG